MKKRRKRRERSLAAAIGLGVAAALGVAILIYLVQMAIPGSAVRNWWELVKGNSGSTLAGSQLGQEFAARLQRQDALFWTPLSLFCGGLVLGRTAPSRSPRTRVLLSGLGLAFGVAAFALAFLWGDTYYQNQLLVKHVGGRVVREVATPDYIVRQAAWSLEWIIVGGLGTYVGLFWRGRSGTQAPLVAPSLRPAKS